MTKDSIDKIPRPVKTTTVEASKIIEKIEKPNDKKQPTSGNEPKTKNLFERDDKRAKR
jgi:hypothetical protein